MKTPFVRFFYLVFFIAFITFFVACNSGSNGYANSKDSAEKHNDVKFEDTAKKDPQAVVDAYSAGLYEIRLADSSKKYVTTKEVKSLATTLEESHTALNDELKELASKKQISLPTDLSGDQNDKIVKLSSKKRLEYDKEFTDDVVSKHEDALSMIEKCSIECTEADIKSWFSKSLPEIRKHLDMAMAANEKLKTIKKSRTR